MSNLKRGDDMPLGPPLRMGLVQKRLASAELVIWAMSKQSGEKFVDIRLWFSEEIAGPWIPSKKGVRVHEEALPALRKLLDSKSGQLLLSKTATRELHGRWIEDSAGKAFDLRYFVKTDSYTGWDKRGVRIRERDCQILRTHLVSVEEVVGSGGGSQCVTPPSRGILDAQDLLEVILN